MNVSDQIAHYALKTLAALKMQSVIKVYEGSISKMAEAFDTGSDAYYIGVKNTDVISFEFRQSLQSANFIIHTVDAMALGGRAIDIANLNPITGRHMTGSSSGTALNVFYDINDIGVGTDGGGSVLAPALSLNLYAMISPLIDQHALRKYSKTSTDGIPFTPSIGFISKHTDYIESVLDHVIQRVEGDSKAVYFAPSPHENHHFLNALWSDSDVVTGNETLSYDGLHRERLMDELRAFDFKSNILITCEGAIDVEAYGDSVMGHYDDYTEASQARGGKYYLKVANMLGLSAFIVPSTHHATGYLILCASEPAAIWQAQKIASEIPFERSELEMRYFDRPKLIKEDVL